MRPVEPTGGESEARSELAEFLEVRDRRRRLLPRAALVGLLAGIVAALFRRLLAFADVARGALIAWAWHAPLVGWIAPVLYGGLGAFLAVLLVQRYAPEAAGSGIPHVEAVLQRRRGLRWARILVVKFAGGVLAMGAGLALGREGPTVQMGSAVGAGVAQRLGSGARERLTLIAAGAGAGLAAAFNAPLSGLVFVLEELQRDFRPGVFGAAFMAAVVADVVLRLAAGQLPVFAIPAYPALPLAALPAVAVLGAASGLLGVAFNRGLLRTLDAFQHARGRNPSLPAALVGAFAGTIAWFMPQAVGGGHALAEAALQGLAPLGGIATLLAVRFALTLLSYGSGAPGGIFAPLLVLGSLLGLGLGSAAHRWAPGVVPLPAVFAVVGMAACFTAIVRAPLTGIVLIVEMTGSYDQMLALLVACFCAYAVAEGLGELPIYESLLRRDLARSGGGEALRGPTVLELEVQPGAPFEGLRLRELGLPGGCIVVRCRDGAREWVPSAATRLDAHVRITVVIEPDAAAALEAVRAGCDAPRS